MLRDEELAETLIEEPREALTEDRDPIVAEEDGAPAGETEQQLRTGANWFYWLAGLSLINSIIILAQGEWSFLFGLGFTQVVDGLVAVIVEEAAETATIVKVVGFGINVLIAGVFVLFGWFANRRHRWAFVVGMVVYLLDALLFLVVGDFLGLAFHAFVLFSLFMGFKACLALTKERSVGPEALHPT